MFLCFKIECGYWVFIFDCCLLEIKMFIISGLNLFCMWNVFLNGYVVLLFIFGVDK